MGARFTDEYKKNFVNEVLKRKEKGIPLSKSVKELGHTPITFRLWKKKFANTKPAEVTFHQAPKTYKKKNNKTTTDNGRVAVFYCTTVQAAEIIKNL